MRNFLRILKISWVAHKRLILLSIISAAFVAVFWSLNLSAAYPVLQILSADKNLHAWVDGEIEAYEKKASDPVRQERITYLRQKQKELSTNPAAPDRDNQENRVLRELAELESQQQDASAKLYRYQLLKTKVIRHFPQSRFATFVWIMLFLVVGIALKGIFEFFQEALVGMVVHRTLFDFRNRFFRAAVHQDLKQIADTGTTDFMARFTNDMEQVGTGMKMLYGRVMMEPLKMAGCVICACLISWKLTFMFVVIVLFAVVMLNKISRMMKKAAKKVLERMSDLYKVLREVFDGLRLVKAFTRESHERRRFQTVNREYYRRYIRVITIDALVGPLLETLGVMAVGVVLIAGAYLVLERQTHILGVRMIEEPMGFEALLTLYVFLATIADPVRKLSSVYTKMQSGMVAADRVFALADRRPLVTPNADGPMLPRHTISIEFRNVCFSYQPDRPTLHDVSFCVRAGETIALVGPNGSGKSTLIGLLARLYDPDHGTILVDGVLLRTANLRSLRKQIGLVTQETLLFDDTIFNNIGYGKPGATPAEVEAAARQAHAHDFIAALPQGYQTRTGDMAASKLSGGQKQRIALARAILRDPRILILDEFTSQIDNESEMIIHETLKSFVRGRTTFLITHRISTLELADRIVVMEAGRVLAIGKHADLLAGCSLYKRLYESRVISAAA